MAPSALTARGFLAMAAAWFGQTAQTRSVSWAEFRSGTTAEYADSSWQHLSRSQYASIEGAHAAGLRPGLRTRSRGARRHPLANRPRSAQGRKPPDRLADPAQGGAASRPACARRKGKGIIASDIACPTGDRRAGRDVGLRSDAGWALRRDVLDQNVIGTVHGLRMVAQQSIRNLRVIRGAIRRQQQRTVPSQRRRCDHLH